MVTVKGKTGRKYEVRETVYGTRNIVYRLYYGGIFLAGSDQRGPNGESSSSLEITIARADARCEELGIEISVD